MIGSGQSPEPWAVERGQLVKAAVVGLTSGGLFAVIVVSYAAALLVVQFGTVTSELLRPLALSLGLAAFAQPSGFRFESSAELIGIGLEFSPMPWIALGVAVAGLGVRSVLRREEEWSSGMVLPIAAFAATFALVVGIAAAVLVASDDQLLATVRYGADVASYAARAFLVAGLVGLAHARFRRRRPVANRRLLGAAASGMGALILVAVVAGAVGLVAATDGLVLGERLLVLAAAPLILVNVGAMALAMVVGAPVVAGVASSVGSTIAASPVAPEAVDGAVRSLPGDRSASAAIILIVILMVASGVSWRLLRRDGVASMGEGIALVMAMAAGFAAAGWLIASLAGIHVEAFTFQAAPVTRSVFGFSAEISAGRMFPGLFVPVAGAGVLMVGAVALRRRLPLRAARARAAPVLEQS